ncbi:MAG TPA: hypothetical protein VIM62_10640 [Acidobacteriaceae bacterium]
MTEALPYGGQSGGIPLFEFVEPEKPNLFAIGCGAVLTVLFGVCLVIAMDYELRHPLVIPGVRGRIEEPQPGVTPRPEVVFSCVLVHPSHRELSVRVMARVSELPGLPPPSGQVRFLIGYETLKVVKLENGAASFTAKVPNSQLHQKLRALYLGDDHYGMNYSNTGGIATVP